MSSLCDNCATVGCIFQAGIEREKCAFYKNKDDLFCKSQLITCNRVKECNDVCPFEDALKHADKTQTMNEQHNVDLLKQSVEIVLCKDCKWEFICRQTVEQINADDVEHRPLEWCSYGKRKRDDGE